MGAIAEDTIAYIKTFIKDRKVASIMPSSRFLVKRVCQRIDFSEPFTLVEYGPGLGVFTKYILARMQPGSHLVLVETNHEFVAQLEDLEKDGVTVHVFNETAENVQEILRTAGTGQADYILSGIPFSFFDDATRHALISKTYDALKPKGRFLVYQHYNHMQEPLEQHFDEVKRDFELINVPPIHIHEAIRA